MSFIFESQMPSFWALMCVTQRSISCLAIRRCCLLKNANVISTLSTSLVAIMKNIPRAFKALVRRSEFHDMNQLQDCAGCN